MASKPRMMSLKIARGDSGQVTGFQPGQHVKPAQSGIRHRLQAAWGALLGRVDPKQTTQLGAPASSSPATYAQSLWAQRYDRIGYIADIQALLLEDPRLKRSIELYASEAVRGGFRIKVTGKDAMAVKAQRVADDFVKLMAKDWWYGVAKKLITEGDGFIQMVVLGDRICTMKRMPASSMERLSDDADEIIDPNNAFEQIDTVTFQTVASFCEALMCHVRWNHSPGDRYGTPECIESRRIWRILKLLEESNAVARFTGSARHIHWAFGTPDVQGNEKDIEDFKAQNGWLEGGREVFNPLEAARMTYGANVEAQVVEGNPHQDDIKDILHAQNALTATQLWPAVLYGLDAESVNRDVVKDIRAEALKGTVRLNESLDEIIRFGFQLQCMLLGIDPTLLTYAITWTTSTIETPGEVIDSVVRQREAGTISLRTALAKLQQYNGFEDLEAELAAIQDEAAQETERAVRIKAAGPEPIAGAENPRKALNGKAKRDEIEEAIALSARH